MTNEKLNQICCEFAGLEPQPGCYCKVDKHTGVVICSAPRIMGFQTPCFKDRLQHPPVSTDWAPAGLLMDALKRNGVYASIRAYQAEFGAEIRTGHRTVQGWADTGPRALCLAVAALAEQSK